MQDELQDLTQAVLDAWDRNHEALTRWDEARLAAQAVLDAQHQRFRASIGQGCDHTSGICGDPSHQNIGGQADGEWFAEQRRRVAENRRRAAERG